jgi:hypothetical protein
MRELLFLHTAASNLHPELKKILDQGFNFDDGHLYLNKFLSERSLSLESNSLDATGQEVFINSFHTDDYIDEGHLEHALAFSLAASNLLKKTASHTSFLKAMIIITATDFGASIKIFQDRPDQPYLSDDLENYGQPILVNSFSNQRSTP